MNAMQRRLRIGRDMAFVAGGLGQGALTEEEKAAWIFVGQLTAEQLGLSDMRRPGENPF